MYYIWIWELVPFDSPEPFDHDCYERLKDLLAREGLTEPINVMWSEGWTVILQGHLRVLAARAVGIYRIPIERL